LEGVWSSPPVDKIKGRTKWTQAHQPWSETLGRLAPVQGRGEYIGLLALEYLKRTGHVERFKEHAFATTVDDLGWEVRPDHFALGGNKALYVIEVKTARFVTAEIQMKLDANRTAFRKFGMKYLVWTDRHPLTRPVRHNLINMRRAATEDVTDGEIGGLVELTRSEGEIPLGAVVDRGFDINCVFSAWWQGKVFLPLTRDVTASTLVSDRPVENYPAIFLDEKPIVDDWWETLVAA
jgi:hypothetical protein